MGSSSVMTWTFLVRLMRSMIQARVVDFPLPAGPVTNTSPLERFESSMMLSGICRVSGEGRSKRTTRITAAREPLCFMTLARKRESPLRENEKSSSPSSVTRFMLRPPAME